jgi:LysM repeat protein
LRAHAAFIPLIFASLATVAHAEPYRVKSGDSLSRIALRYGTTVKAIKQVNGLSSDLIVIGQRLDIPTEATAFEPHAEDKVYRVRSGDSLARIGQRFGVPWGKIKRANNLTSNTIHVGQVLVIPRIPGEDDGLPLDVQLPSETVSTTTVTTAPTQGSTTVNASSGSDTSSTSSSTELEPFSHVVRSGNTLSKLALQYQTSVGEIKALNGLTSDVIHIGQRLRIPGQEPVDPTKFHIRHPARTASTAELTTLARLIQSEVPANAPYEGAVAVAAVVLNRVRSAKFPDTITKVVSQRGYDKKRQKWVYQFSGYNDARYRAPVKDYAWRAAREALAGADPVAGSDHYYNPFLVAPRWAKGFSFVRRIGTTSRTAHDFYHSDTVGFAQFLQGQ